IGNVNGGTVNVTNTIFALNTPDCAQPVTSSVSSLDQSGSTSSCGVQIHANPALGALTDNGGPTGTRTISTTSPAFNVGTGACPPTDQRGFTRETGRNCDLGAYGVIRADLGITKTAPASVSAGQTFTYTVTVTNNGPSATQLARVSDTLPSGVTF